MCAECIGERERQQIIKVDVANKRVFTQTQSERQESEKEKIFYPSVFIL